tara:strand:+ start:3034 stop:3465 length:432 start_codon:yes stop_codon:yes gene_type:complete
MKNIFFYILILIFSYIVEVSAKDNFFEEAKNFFEKKKYEKSKFLFQRSIVFNPKHANSYLYLAKIFNIQEDENEELKNINTTLLLDPNNEEALYMLIDIKLKRSNFSEVKELQKRFNFACSTLCDKKKSISERLDNIDIKDNS